MKVLDAEQSFSAHAKHLAPCDSSCVRRRLFVQGIVQGVGFRPWVHQLAHAHMLSGYVLNSTLGVTIEIEGSEEDQLRFLSDFRSHPPLLAVIDEVHEEILDPIGYPGFEIRESRAAPGEFVLVPPDIATCEDCLTDFRDPANRRFGYPFTNCTHCGPRYSIVQDIPYDRRFTTMSEFRMCAACEAEYHNPSDRRFHAQPNACPECGPWVELWDRERLLVHEPTPSGKPVVVSKQAGSWPSKASEDFIWPVSPPAKNQCGCCASESGVRISRSL